MFTHTQMSILSAIGLREAKFRNTTNIAYCLCRTRVDKILPGKNVIATRAHVLLSASLKKNIMEQMNDKSMRQHYMIRIVLSVK